MLEKSGLEVGASLSTLPSWPFNLCRPPSRASSPLPHLHSPTGCATHKLLSLKLHKLLVHRLSYSWRQALICWLPPLCDQNGRGVREMPVCNIMETQQCECIRLKRAVFKSRTLYQPDSSYHMNLSLLFHCFVSTSLQKQSHCLQTFSREKLWG